LKFDDNTYKRLFPSAILTTVEGAAHYVHTDKPKIAIESIALFLESVEQKMHA
jgi:pimeloyl-ACP methyl ester carboxylesterase